MNFAKNWYARTVAGVSMLTAYGMAHAASGPLDSMFDAVDLSGIQAKIVAMATTIIGIALAMKGPSLVKRLIAKI